MVEIEELIKKRVKMIFDFGVAELIAKIVPSLHKLSDMENLAQQGETILGAAKVAAHEAELATLVGVLYAMPRDEISCADLLKLQGVAEHAVENKRALAHDAMLLLEIVASVFEREYIACEAEAVLQFVEDLRSEVGLFSSEIAALRFSRC